MFPLQRLLPFLGLLAAFCAYGCGPSAFGGPHTRLPWYSVGFANDTDQKLTDVEATWPIGNFPYKTRVGVLSPGGEKINNEEADPIPAKATVWWTDPAGKRHSQTVEVAGKIPRVTFFAGTVWFKITGKGVEMIPLADGSQWLPIRKRT